jgi:hypothetical protein
MRMPEPSAITTIVEGPHQGRRARILNKSRSLVIVLPDGRAAIYLYRSPGVHRFKGWADVIFEDGPSAAPAVPVRQVQVVDQIHHWDDAELREKREQLAALSRRRRSWWRRLWDRLFSRPIGGSDG